MPSTRRQHERPRRSLFLATACLLVLHACAAPKPPPPKPSLFVLLPESGDGAGMITITTQSGTQVLTQGRQATAVPGLGSAPQAPVVLDETQIRQTFGGALAALPPEVARFTLYFKGNSDELTPESLALLPSFFAAVRDRAPADISIVGHTDTMGERDYNYRLGLRRANQVANLLAAQGVDRSTLDIDSHGKDDLLVPTGDQVPEPKNR